MAEDRYKYFRVEAREILDQLGRCALDLEKEDSPSDVVGRLLRLAHTLKGAARVVGQQEVADRSHALEEVLAPFRDAGAVPRDLIDRVLALVDDIGRGVARIPGASAAAPAERAPNEPPAPLLSFRPEVGDLDALLRGVLEARMRLGTLETVLTRVARGRQLAAAIVEQAGQPESREVAGNGGPWRRSKVAAFADELRAVTGAIESGLSSSVDQLDRELRRVREAAERLRLAPVGGLFMFLERGLRDAATALGKRVVFEASGGEVRVDSFVLGVLQGALLHVVRNAAAHGIEDPAERLAAGKPGEGRVTLRVTQRGRMISVSCSDDGRGVDLEAVQRIARRRGIELQSGATSDPQEILRVLLRGGISTSREVTDVSGRGIGLDVVREAVDRLHGTVAAQTARGEGTTITLTVPLSVASFEALVVESAGGRFAIPLDAVSGALRVAPADIIRNEGREAVMFDKTAVPLVALQHLIDRSTDSSVTSGRLSAVVVRGSEGAAALAVDRLAGTVPIVMRPLPDLAPASDLAAGAVLDDAGDPFVVLDPDELVATATRAGSAVFAPEPARAPVLVVDDSLTTRMLEQSILLSAGFDVDVAASGEEALTKARERRYALFLVDVEMPGMDGFTLIERIRADASLREIPAVLVTSRNAPEDHRRAEAVGAQGYMVKSEFDQERLLQHIRRLIR